MLGFHRLAKRLGMRISHTGKSFVESGAAS
jgi:hypothetical protein